jgi:pyroglutamyl-peptidase
VLALSDGTTTLTVLATGFSAFPGAPSNPTEALVTALQDRKDYFARHKIRLEARVLPVIHATIAAAISEHVEALSPDIILHFGLALQRTRLSIETLARNHVSQTSWDAVGRQAEHAAVLREGAPVLKASIPTAEIANVLQQAGYACDLSEDAGDYLCNTAFYLSLATPHAARVGFVHVPPLTQSAANAEARGALTTPRLLHAAEIIILKAAEDAAQSLAKSASTEVARSSLSSNDRSAFASGSEAHVDSAKVGNRPIWR